MPYDTWPTGRHNAGSRTPETGAGVNERENGREIRQPIDSESRLMIEILRAVHDGITPIPSDTAQYVKFYARDFEWIRRVLNIFGLAEEAPESVLGWKPTAKLVRIVAQRAVWQTKPSKKEPTARDHKLVELLFQLTGCKKAEIRNDDFPRLFTGVLTALGFLRLTREGGLKATSLTKEMFERLFDA
jgi:hypothetical protein